MKGTGRQLNAIVAAFIGSLVIPCYFLRLMADGRKLQRRLSDRSSLGLRPVKADLRQRTPDQVFD